MNAHELYDKMAEIRDEYWEKHRDSACDRCNDVFVQILSAAFTNKYERNQLPEVFPICKVDLSTDELEKLITHIGLNVSIKLTNSTFLDNSFEVTIK